MTSNTRLHSVIDQQVSVCAAVIQRLKFSRLVIHMVTTMDCNLHAECNCCTGMSKVKVFILCVV